MKVKIQDATDLSNKILRKLGFTSEEATLITENVLEGELTNKKTHGFVRILWLRNQINEEKVKVLSGKIEIVKETPVSLLVDGKGKTGFIVVNKALQLGINKAKKIGLVAVGVTNTAPASGLIGLYARKATENNLIFIGFNNSSGGLVPFGAIQELWGTNPLTVGIPTNDLPVILDMASSQITWGELLLAKLTGSKLKKGVAIDKEGNVTTDPEKAMEGGLLPIAGHKGSGLAFIVELLGGALTKSRVGHAIQGGWGSFFILIKPDLFRDLNEFKSEVEVAIKDLKNLPKQKGVNEIYYPGEQSQKLRRRLLRNGFVEIDDKLWSDLILFTKNL